MTIMPILWRFLLSWYLKGFTLAIVGLTALLMAARLHDIASLASLGMSWSVLGYYTLCQIPPLLPIVVAFASFLATLLMGHFLFREREIIALASCRLPFKEFFWPIIAIATLVSLGNFFLISEGASHCQLVSRQMVFDLQKTSPMILLKKPELIDRGHFAAFTSSSHGSSSDDFVFVFFQPRQGRLALIKADEIGVENGSIIAHNALLVSTKPSGLLIENIGKTIATGDLFAWLGQTRRALHHSQLSLKELFASPKLIKVEVGYRLAFGLIPLSLALFGLSLAPYKRILWPTLTALLVIGLILFSKKVHAYPLSLFYQFGTQLLLIAFSLLFLKKRRLI